MPCCTSKLRTNCHNTWRYCTSRTILVTAKHSEICWMLCTWRMYVSPGGFCLQCSLTSSSIHGSTVYIISWTSTIYVFAPSALMSSLILHCAFSGFSWRDVYSCMCQLPQERIYHSPELWTWNVPQLVSFSYTSIIGGLIWMGQHTVSQCIHLMWFNKCFQGKRNRLIHTRIYTRCDIWDILAYFKGYPTLVLAVLVYWKLIYVYILCCACCSGCDCMSLFSSVQVVRAVWIVQDVLNPTSIWLIIYNYSIEIVMHNYWFVTHFLLMILDGACLVSGTSQYCDGDGSGADHSALYRCGQGMWQKFCPASKFSNCRWLRDGMHVVQARRYCSGIYARLFHPPWPGTDDSCDLSVRDPSRQAHYTWLEVQGAEVGLEHLGARTATGTKDPTC